MRNKTEQTAMKKEVKGFIIREQKQHTGTSNPVLRRPAWI